jgi:hypothetical protein
MAKFSMKRINETWLTYDEILAKNYPGYLLCDKREILVNKSDVLVSMDELLALLRSKDFARYD